MKGKRLRGGLMTPCALLAVPVAPAVVVLALALAPGAVAEDEPDPSSQTPRSEAARGAAREWCEARGGEFDLNDKLVPLCLAYDPDVAVPVVFVGIGNPELTRNPTWW